MNKFLYFICLVLCFASCCQSVVNNTATCLLIPKHEYVMLYDKAEGYTIADSIINDTIQENYVLISIIKMKRGRAQIKVQYPLNDTIQIGWIDKQYLGIHPVSVPIIYLYNSPHKKASICDSITNVYWGDFLSVKECNSQWLYIETGEHKGWISPNDQCNNPYSTCN